MDEERNSSLQVVSTGHRLYRKYNILIIRATTNSCDASGTSLRLSPTFSPSPYLAFIHASSREALHLANHLTSLMSTNHAHPHPSYVSPPACPDTSSSPI